ncbi:hypothetical protein H5410_002051 [Solanum commersonii]|uniref:Uncharacterized protein n=1 Tax=Solanum commersonii TaxID=4109 RepID=A0A9J6B0S8_SOLCO|nr:hypothetical protein H5410_002051 [Solanum commersonii]
MVSKPWTFMNIIKKKSIVKNSRKEEYDIPQHLDLLNKWTIPKISPRIIYQMRTFEKFAPYRDIYRFMHIGLVQDEKSLSSLMLNVKLHGYDYMPGTEVVCICYRIYYKLLHTLNPMCKVIDLKNETILIETNFDKSKLNDGTVKIRFHEPTNMLIDNRSMSSRISRSNSSYISPIDYIVQVPSRASTSQIRETYRCDNIKIDKDNIVKPIRRVSSDLE